MSSDNETCTNTKINGECLRMKEQIQLKIHYLMQYPENQKFARSYVKGVLEDLIEKCSESEE